MRIAGLILITGFLLGTSIMAQDGYPLPDELQPITVENAEQLQELASIGGVLPGQLAWSPDGKTLAAGTSEDLRLYDTSDFETPPRIIPEHGNFYFNTDGELVLNEQRWNVQTGERLGSGVTPDTINGPGGTPQVRVIEQNEEETIAELQKPDGETTSLRFSSEYTFDGIVFSPDERFAALILTSHIDGYDYPAVQLWNIADGTLIADLPQNLEILVTVAFHADGKLLVTAVTTDAPYGGPFEFVQIWDGRTGEVVAFSSYLPVRFSPDGSLMAVMTYDGVALWTDHELGVLKFNVHSETGQIPILFSRDSSTMTIAWENEISLWDVNTEQVPDAPRQTMTTEGRISNLLYSPDESQLVSTESGGIIEIWDAQSGERQTRIIAPDSVYNVRFSPDGQYLHGYVFGMGQMLWDARTGETILETPPRTAFNTDLSFAAYWDGGVVRVIDTNSGQETPLTILPDFLGSIAAFSPAAERVIFSDTEQQMIDLRNGEQVLSVPVDEGVPWAKFSPNGEYLILGSRPIVSGRGDPQILNIRETRNPEQLLARHEIAYGGSNWLLSPDGKYLSALNPACGDGGGGSHSLWDTATGEQLRVWHPGGSCGPYAHFFSPDGKWLIVGWDYELVVFDMATLLEETAETDSPSQDMPAPIGGIFYNQPIRQIILSPDGIRLAVTLEPYPYGEGGTDAAYEMDIYQFSDFLTGLDNQTLRENRVQIPDSQLAIFSPESQWILTDSGLWNVSTGEQLAHVSSKTAAFHPDSTILAAATDEELVIWNLSTPAAGNTSPLMSLDIADVRELAFSPDGNLLYIRQTGQIQVWGVINN